VFSSDLITRDVDGRTVNARHDGAYTIATEPAVMHASNIEKYRDTRITLTWLLGSVPPALSC